MATTRSQAARDAAAEITTDREPSTSVASDVQTENMMAFLQQTVSHQTEERRAREIDKEEQGKREREKESSEEERFQDLKDTIGEKLVQFSCRIDEVKEEMGRQKISIIQHDHTLSNLQQQFGQLLWNRSVYQQREERIDMDCQSRPYIEVTPGDAVTGSMSPEAPPSVSSSVHRMNTVPVQRPTLYDGKTPWIQYEMTAELNGGVNQKRQDS